MPNPDSIRFLIVLIPLILMAAGLKKPLYAAIGYMIFVYCKTCHYFPVFEQIRAELLFALIICLRIIIDQFGIKKLSVEYNRVNLYMLLFTLSIGLSYMFAWNQKVSWDYAVYHFIKTAIIYFMVIMSLDTEKDLKIFTWSFILMFVYLAYEPMYGFIFKSGGSDHLYGTIYIGEVGLLSGHVALANNMNQMIPIAFFIIFSFKKKYQKLLAAIPLVIFLGALIGSGSRGGVLGFLFFGLVLIFMSKKRFKTGMIVGVMSFILFITSSMLSSTLGRVNIDHSEGRLLGLTHGINMLKLGNIFGVGPGCFAIARGYYHGYSMDSHNIYGQVIGELGIPGTIVWFLLIRETFLNLSRSKKILKTMTMEKSFYFYLASGLQASLIVRLFISLASHGLYFFYWYILAGMSAAMIVAVNKIESGALKPEKEMNKLIYSVK